jgi:hypothetical protein
MKNRSSLFASNAGETTFLSKPFDIAGMIFYAPSRPKRRSIWNSPIDFDIHPRKDNFLEHDISVKG